MKHFVWFFVVTAMLAMPVFSAQTVKIPPNNHEVKYVIFMVPDGMGLANVTATRILHNCDILPTNVPPPEEFCAEGPGGPPLSFESLEHIGYQRTFSKTNTITDSSAAASAWACGEKFVNNEVCFHADEAPHNDSLLEIAKMKGWGTGLVATQTITHATPASFAAHIANRNCESAIAQQYILGTDNPPVQATQPDVLLGGGKSKFFPSSADVCGGTGASISQITGAGYTYVDTKADMDSAAASPGVRRLVGLFAGGALTPEYLGTRPADQPRLPDMTGAALEMLDRYRAGFFLMVEGSLIDSGNHAESVPYQYGEMLAFDESVKVVLDWIGKSPDRKQHTLLIVVADHETGGFAVKGLPPRGGENPNAGLGPFLTTPVQAGVEPPGGWVFTLMPGTQFDFEAHHTGGDTMIWSQGPGSEALGAAIDNTFVYQVVKEVIR